MQSKVILQPNEQSKSVSTKRPSLEHVHEVSNKKRKAADDEEEDVDYGEIEPEVEETDVAVDSGAPEHPQVEEREAFMDAERPRIHTALESWCRSNVSTEEGDSDDRVGALAEVGMLLVFEQDKYPDAESMRAELEDIGSIIGGDQVVKKYINFLLSLQNQLKKSKAMAERQHRQHQFARTVPPPPHHQMMYPMHPMPFPMMMHPQQFGQMYPQAPHFAPPAARGNMTLNATGEMSIVQKQKEKEKKRKEILHECTEHLKALLERASKAGSPEEKAKIFELIDKVKKRIDSLRETHPQPPAGIKQRPNPQGAQGIRGYYGNQYVNPSLVAQPETHDQQGASQ